MPRTMAVIGLTFFFSLWIFMETSLTVAFIAAVAATAGFAASMIIKSMRREAVFPAIFLTVLAASVLLTVQMKTVYEPALSFAGKDVNVTAKVCELPYINKSGRHCYTLETINVNNVPYSVKILFTSGKDINAQPCDIVSFCGDIYVRGGDDLSVKENLMSSGVWLGAYTNNSVSVSEGKKNINYYFLKIRQYTENTILSALPQREASVLIALLLGNTSYLSDEFYTNSQRCGILHIFAVSGFNLSLFAMSLLNFLKKRKVNRYLTVLLPMLTVLFVMAVTGFSQSCVRAGIMLLVLFAGKLFSHRADALNSLGIAVLVICFIDPFQASSAALQLSFFASGTVILVSPFIDEKIRSNVNFGWRPINSLWRYIISTFLTSVCVIIVLLPITLNLFGAVSLIAPIVNCFVVFASEWEMVLGFIAVIVSSLGALSFFAKPIFLATGILSDYISETTEFFGRFKYSYVSANYPIIHIWIVCILLAIAFIILMRTSVLKRFVYSVAVSVLSLSVALGFIIADKDTVTFTMLNTSCAVVSCKDKTVIIGNVDTYDCLQDIRDIAGDGADVFMVTDTENNGFMMSLLSDFEVGEIVVPSKTYDTLPWSYYKTQTVAKKYSLTVSENLKIGYAYTKGGCVVFISANGKNILMLQNPGTDISYLPNEWHNADIAYCINDIPFNLESDKFGQVIVSANKKRCDRLSKVFATECENVTFTSGKKTVLEISKDGFCKIK